MLATKFIIALCPAVRIYLAGNLDIKGSASTDKSKALVFDTFEAAMEVCKDITGWGGAQRVEEIAVEVPDTRVTLDTPEARIEVRDNATAQYNAAIEAGYAERNAAEEVAKELRSLGIKVGVDYRDGASCTVSLYLADHLCNLLDLNWDPMQDGFSYDGEGDDACDIGETEAQHEAEPDHGCAGNCKPLSPKAARALRKWGMDKCQRAWHLNRLRGEGLTVCSIETGIPLRSVDSAINAWQEVWAQNFVPQTCSDCGETNDTVRILDLGDGGHALCSKCNTPDIIPCDGCDSTDAVPCGDPEGFAFCAACRAKDANAPRE